MELFRTMLLSELRNILRERMTVLMLFMPLAMGVVIRVLIEREIVEGDVLGVLAVVCALLAGFMFGALAGFSLLDDRDDQVLLSIGISPYPLWAYVWFKVGFSFLLAIGAGVALIALSGAVPMGTGDMVLVSIASAAQVPIVAFLVNAFATNKVEGFVTMKATGFLLLFPIGGYFFLDAKEWLFAIAPGHWAAKAVQRSMMAPLINAGVATMNMGLRGYAIIGIVYNLILAYGAYRLFLKKNQL